SKLLREVEILDHLLFVFERTALLIVQYFGCIPYVAREKHHEVRFEIAQGVVCDGEAFERHRTIAMKIEAREPSDRGAVLILLANSLAQRIDLDVASLLGDLRGRNVLAF